MGKMAIMVDGGFYRVRANQLFKTRDLDAAACADKLESYCQQHVHAAMQEGHPLYRIFYYDCPPIAKSVYHPLRKIAIDLSKSPTFKKSSDFFAALTTKSRVAIRHGKLSLGNCRYAITQKAQEDLLRGKKQISDLTDRDLRLDIGQKGVDMRLGLDLVSLALKRLVDQVVLITGDSDFVPAIKMARREGVEIVLDPMGLHVTDDLREHIDDTRSFV